MANNFDDVSKGLASHATRRGALRLFGAAVVGAVAATFRPGGANADDGNVAQKCNKACKGLSGEKRIACVRSCVCEGLGGTICGPGKVCCPKGTKCSSVAINGFVDLGVNGTVSGSLLTCIPINNIPV